MPESLTIPLEDGSEITSVYHAPPDVRVAMSSTILVIMMHDFPNSSKVGVEGMFEMLETAVTAQGHHSFRFDYVSCGDRAGKPDEFTLASAQRDLAAALAWADQEGQFTKIALVSEGFSAIPAVMCRNPKIVAQVFLYPIFDPALLLRTRFKVEPDIPMPVEEAAGYTVVENTKVGMALVQELKALDLQPHLKQVAVPSMVQHGAKDEFVPMANLDVAREHLGSPRLDITVYEPSGHGLTAPKEREMVAFHIQQFLGKYV